MRHPCKRAAALVLLAVVVAGCAESPTQIVLTIDGDRGFAEVSVDADEVEAARATLPLDGGLDLPLTLTLLHGGGELAPFPIRAAAYAATGEAIARDCDTVSFDRGSTVEARLSLVRGSSGRCGNQDDGGVPDAGGGADAGPSCDPVACAQLAANAECVEGYCRITNCPLGTADCDVTAPSCDTNTFIDVMHCGGCNRPCMPGKSCEGGTCL